MKLQYERHEELIDFFRAVETGLITITLSEFTMLPVTLMPAWRMYKQTIAQHKKGNTPNG